MTHLEVVLLYPELLYYEVTPPDTFPLRPIFRGVTTPLVSALAECDIMIALKEEARIQLTQKEFDFMADAGAYEDIERVNANCTLKDNLQQASTSGTQTDKAPIYDSDE
ncbi:hypothetical protein Tco_0726230 [Tanacetum coccineum]|uniref:Uncharacterized protein n=1 Tax=Tanacetum coccineum TaxID=301880 RepID=A0ABQ4YF24_9ASTR